MRNVHFLIQGDEPSGTHVAGLSRLRGEEAIVFAWRETNSLDSLSKLLNQMGVPYRVVTVESSYLSCYRKASHEAASAFTKTECVGINMSTGPGPLRTAIEDAVRVQHYHFLHHTSEAEASAFKYFVDEGEVPTVTVVPVWDFATYPHNDIFELLVATERPVTLADMHKALARTMGREAPNWEAFRKTFREFKRGLAGSPCLMEVVGKGPRYRIQI